MCERNGDQTSASAAWKQRGLGALRPILDFKSRTTFGQTYLRIRNVYFAL
jgi:hypothetical protein